MFYKLLGICVAVMLVLTVLTGNPAVALMVGVIFVPVAGFVQWLFSDREEEEHPASHAPRCPHCGSPVRVRGSRWECGWCGDHGDVSSLRKH